VLNAAPHSEEVEGGATAFLLKPVDGQALLTAIAAVTQTNKASGRRSSGYDSSDKIIDGHH
jgi:hypothetical protein